MQELALVVLILVALAVAVVVPVGAALSSGSSAEDLLPDIRTFQPKFIS